MTPLLTTAALAHAAPSVLAAFLAALVEFVEALTVVLAVGTVRGWRPALTGTGLGLAVLAALVLALGPALTRIPLGLVQLAVGTLVLLFGLRWLRKAVLRSAGVIPLHDEAAAFAGETEALRRHGTRGGRLGRGRGRDRVQDRHARGHRGRVHRRRHRRRRPRPAAAGEPRRLRRAPPGRAARPPAAPAARPGAGERAQVRGRRAACPASAPSGPARAWASPGRARTGRCWGWSRASC